MKWLLPLLLLAVGCGEDHAVAVETSQAELSWSSSFRPIDYRRLALLPEAEVRARQIAREKLQEAANARCGACREPSCAFQCIFGEEDELVALGDGSVLEDCLACGRETGFLPRPELRLARIGEKTIELSWDAVDGATLYSVTGLQWSPSEPEVATGSYMWQTEATVLQLTLEEGHRYSFRLVAWSEGEVKVRSQPSEPVSVDL